jgi:hypothetical protein
MAHTEDKLAWFKRNMNRVKTVDTEHLVFTFNILVYFICYHSSKYVLNLSRLLCWS